MSFRFFRLLLLLIGVSLPSSHMALSQRNAPQTVSSLRKQIQEAEAKRLPKTQADLARQLYMLGLKQRNASIAAEGLFKQDQALGQINNEHNLDLYSLLDGLMKASWLSSQERSLVAALSIVTYQRQQQRNRRNDGDISLVRDSIVAKGWTPEHYERRYTQLLGVMMSTPKILELDATSYQEIFRLYRISQDRDENQYLPQSFLNALMGSLGGYGNRYYGRLTSQELLRTLTKSLEQYPKPASNTNERLHLEAALIRLKYLVNQEDNTYFEELDKLLSRYHTQRDAIYYYYFLNGYWRKKYGRRYLVKSIDTILAELAKRGEGQSPFAKSLHEEKRSLLQPELWAKWQSYILPTQKQANIEIRTELIEHIEITCYQRPLVTTDEWRPGGNALSHKTYTIPEDPKWEGRRDTLAFEFPREGSYVLRLIATPQAEAQGHYSKQLDTVYLNIQMSRYNVVSWYDDLSAQSILHWLDGNNGHPLIDGKIKSIESVFSPQNASPRISNHITDKLGRIYLKSDHQWTGSLVLESPEEGSLSLGHHFWGGHEPKDTTLKNKEQLSLYSDRGVYRPGQDIHVYGIASTISWHSEEAKVIPHTLWRAKLYAPQNGGEPIATEKIMSDELGRFSCAFTLPQDAVAGRYSIQIEPQNSSEQWYQQRGHLNIDVAHYKRPQIELLLSSPSKPYSFGDSIQIPIQVQEYSGGGIANAPVSVSVEKVYLWPNYYRHTTKSYELKTDVDGKAILSLKLDEASDQNTSNHNAPIWIMPLEGRSAHLYNITVSAQSTTGESQERHLELFAGDRIISLELDAPQSINRDSDAQIKFKTKSAQHTIVSVPVSYTLLSGTKTVKNGSCNSWDMQSVREIFKGVPSGHYRLRYSTPLNSQTVYQQERDITIYGHRDHKLSIPDSIPFLVLTPKTEYETKERLRFGLATSLREAHIYCQVLADNKLILDTLLRPEIGRIYWHDLPLPDDMTELVTIRAYTMHAGRLIKEHVDLTRKQPNKDLSLRWIVFRDRILSGSNEEWRMQVLHQGKPMRDAAVASWMYDASLDAIAAPLWRRNGSPLLRISPRELFDHDVYLTSLLDKLDQYTSGGYISFVDQMGSQRLDEVVLTTFDSAPQALRSAKIAAPASQELSAEDSEAQKEQETALTPPLQIRQDMRELAYHYPKMLTDERGEVSWRFVLPEVLTRWRVEVVAHTSDLNYGHLTSYTEAYRSLQAKAFLPRFLREGDNSSLSASVRNLSEKRQDGQLQLEIFDLTSDSVLIQKTYPFALEVKEMASFAFDVDAPQGYHEVGVRIIARSNEFSDGEQHRLPIISNIATEHRSLAHTIRHGERAEIDLSALLPPSGHIPSQGQLKIRLESQPIYLALLALPRQADVKSDNAIDLSTALYAQRLARYLAQDGSLVLELKKRLQRTKPAATINPTTLYSSILAQEDEGKLLGQLIALLEEAPSQEKEGELIKRLVKIGQDEHGLIPWFSGFKGSSSVTEVVLKQLLRSHSFLASGREESNDLRQYIQKAWTGLEYRLTELLNEEQNIAKRDGRNTSASLPWGALEYLYLSTLDQERSVRSIAHYTVLEPRLRKVVHQLGITDKAKAAHIYRIIDSKLGKELAQSIEEHLTYSQEGAFFADEALQAYWWYNRSYETIALAVESISKMRGWAQKETTAMQEWMLAQKRGVRWESSLATNEALHTLMLGKDNTIAHDRGIEASVISYQGEHTQWQATQRSEITLPYRSKDYPKTLVLAPLDSSMVWVSAEANYPLPISEQRASGLQMTLTRQHFVREIDASSGEERLVPIHATTKLKTGQKLVVQLYLQLDRDLDFVRLSDPRVGCAEPTNILAGYRWATGAPHYFEPRDEETAFYFDHLRRGQYKLEYEQTIVRPGIYQLPAANVVCLYAPEYRASSGVASSLQVSNSTNE